MFRIIFSLQGVTVLKVSLLLFFMFFSHDIIRPSQKELLSLVSGALNKKKNVLVHAPTGLGKTAAVLSPCVELALKRDLTVFFLTARHTQHKIVHETAQKLRKKHNVSFICSSIIGKKSMCAQDNVSNLFSSDFFEYCRSLVEKNKCVFFSNTRGKDNFRAKKVLSELENLGYFSSEDVINFSLKEQLCPYEISLMLAEKSKVVVCDYSYVFNPFIRNAFFNKTKKRLESAIIIVDEGHNLPSRVRDFLSSRISDRIVNGAFKESEKFAEEVKEHITLIKDLFKNLVLRLGSESEVLVEKDFVVSFIDSFKDFDEFVEDLILAAEFVREHKRSSFIGSIANFLKSWQLGDDSFARFVSRTKEKLVLNNVCLDPSSLTKDVFDSCFSSVVMSGTLSPLPTFADLLGLKGSVSRSFSSPFPEKNKKVLIVPSGTTKFVERNEKQFRKLGTLCAAAANSIPGDVMIFFPSYALRDSVEPFFSKLYKKTIFSEVPNLSQEVKDDLLQRFSSYKDSGAAFLCASSGSFGEGVDLPGVLKGVIVVGLPLDRPDIETKELIRYYDEKFGKGWDYGYVLPAMTKTIQNAGRCIRSETDKGVLVFIDERFVWPRYKKYFPPDWDVRVVLDFVPVIEDFFN